MSRLNGFIMSFNFNSLFVNYIHAVVVRVIFGLKDFVHFFSFFVHKNNKVYTKVTKCCTKLPFCTQRWQIVHKILYTKMTKLSACGSELAVLLASYQLHLPPPPPHQRAQASWLSVHKSCVIFVYKALCTICHFCVQNGNFMYNFVIFVYNLSFLWMRNEKNVKNMDVCYIFHSTKPSRSIQFLFWINYGNNKVWAQKMCVYNVQKKR